MNRLYFSNNAISSLNTAREKKVKLISLDRKLSAVQTEIFILKLKNARGINVDIISKTFEEQRIESSRKEIISDIADNIYTAIINALSALKNSITTNNMAMVILDDHLIQTISGFINEYYKNNEIKYAIKDRVRFSSIQYDIIQLSTNTTSLMPGLMSLQSALM